MAIRLLGLGVVLACLLVFDEHAVGATAKMSFTGSCSLRGTDAFVPSLELSAGAGSATAVATGTCSGVVKSAAGVQYVHATQARYSARAVSTALSCAGGVGTGQGVLEIGGARFAFHLVEPQVTVVSALTLSGDAGGSAVGIASVVDADPLGLIAACLDRGIAVVPISLALVGFGLA